MDQKNRKMATVQLTEQLRKSYVAVQMIGRLQMYLKKSMVFCIHLYKKYLSPLKTTKCPYFPSCSDYAIEAISKHGPIKGGLLAGWRILRCNPFSKGGYDPVP